MDLLNLLPEGDVSVGDRWTVPGEKLATIFLPGGSAGFPAEPEDDTFAPTLETLEAQMDALIEDLSIECEYEGVRQEGDVEVAVIKFVNEGDVTIDLSDFLGDILSEQEVPFDVEATLSVDIELDGRGQLLWNLGAHHAHDFEMEAELTLAAEGDASMDMDGESHAAEGTAEVIGRNTSTPGVSIGTRTIDCCRWRSALSGSVLPMNIQILQRGSVALVVYHLRPLIT
jgi:hypothetical protein